MVADWIEPIQFPRSALGGAEEANCELSTQGGRTRGRLPNNVEFPWNSAEFPDFPPDSSASFLASRNFCCLVSEVK